MTRADAKHKLPLLLPMTGDPPVDGLLQKVNGLIAKHPEDKQQILETVLTLMRAS